MAGFSALVCATSVMLLHAPDAAAGAPSTAPQVLLAITNSESMDGTTAGAIMVGSGSLGASLTSLSASSSPTSYTPSGGFNPPVSAVSAGVAPYTAACTTNSSDLCDNSQSRMNMTKAAIQQVLASYGNTLNFGIYTYASSKGSAPSASKYTTWVYYMSPASSGLVYTNSASSTTVANPCYAYGSASSSVNSACASIAAASASGVSASTLSGSRYINIGAASDNPLINDVLYASGGLPGVFLTAGNVSPLNPYSYYSLSTYNTNIGGYSVSYSQTAPSIGNWSTTPTNAGYVPFSPQVLYAQRGFGYGGSQSSTTGYAAVAMGTDPTTSTAFTTALGPETNNSSTSEIKSFAGQSGIYALMNGAKSYLSGVTHGSCQPQYVVLLTDGLPTLDRSGNAWPPLGTATANAYSLTASYNSDGSFASSNSQAVTDAISAIAALKAAGIKVYVLGLGAGVDPTVNGAAANLLTAMAIAGGTAAYFAATDPTSLNNAFLTIVNQIYSENSVSAPVAPISVSSGGAFEYQLTSIPTPVAGHVKAYAVSSSGTLAASASWDAAALMTTTTRSTSLLAALPDNTFTTLSNLDAAAWSLTATSCVPSTATIVGYTIDPSYSGGPCNYLGTRRSGWLMGGFSTQDTGRYVGPPASSLLTQKYASYLAYARANAGRTPMLLFTNHDGFLYAVTASTGVLRWGWTSRNLVAKLQNYSTFPGSSATDGNFAVVDAMDGSGVWGSYVVGSLQGGAEHYSFKLDTTGAPAIMIYDGLVSGGTVAGDTAGATGSTPLRQPPIIAYIGNTAYMVYVITVGTTSTLYETNIATGATTSATLSIQVSSALSLESANNRLWLGGADGSLWAIMLNTGTASTDAAAIVRTGTMINPANGATVANPLYVGYIEVSGAPYFYALTSSELEVFHVTSSGWTPMWAATTSAGYTYNSGTLLWTVNSAMATLTSGAVVSDLPLSLGAALLVPVYVPGSGCSAGTGYYDFFGLASMRFSTGSAITANGVLVTSNISVGPGPAFTPSVSFTSQGIGMSNGSKGCTGSNCGTLKVGSSYPTAPFSWRQH